MYPEIATLASLKSEYPEYEEFLSEMYTRWAIFIAHNQGERVNTETTFIKAFNGTIKNPGDFDHLVEYAHDSYTDRLSPFGIATMILYMAAAETPIKDFTLSEDNQEIFEGWQNSRS